MNRDEVVSRFPAHLELSRDPWQELTMRQLILDLRQFPPDFDQAVRLAEKSGGKGEWHKRAISWIG